MPKRDLILLSPDDYKNIKYTGVHRTETIYNANEIILSKVNAFNALCQKEYDDLYEQINKKISKRIEKLSDQAKKDVLQKASRKIDLNFSEISLAYDGICERLDRELSGIISDKKLLSSPNKLAIRFAETVDAEIKKNCRFNPPNKFCAVTNNKLAICSASVLSEIDRCLTLLQCEYIGKMKKLFEEATTDLTEYYSKDIEGITKMESNKLKKVPLPGIKPFINGTIEKAKEELFNNEKNLHRCIADVLNGITNLENLVSAEKGKIKEIIDNGIKSRKEYYGI